MRVLFEDVPERGEVEGRRSPVATFGNGLRCGPRVDDVVLGDAVFERQPAGERRRDFIGREGVDGRMGAVGHVAREARIEED